MREGFRVGIPYVAAVVSVAVALFVTLAAGQRVIGAEALFFGAVTYSAWYGGLGPGLLATAIASIVSAYFFFNPVSGARFDIDDVARVFVFLTVSILISSLHDAARRAQRKLQQAEQDATSANLAKDRFLAALSHELRNPLMPVVTLASMMERDAGLPRAIRDDAATIRRNIELESQLIDDLLDLNRIVSGKLRMEFQVVDVHRLLGETVESCRPDIARKNLRMVTHLSADAHCVRADPLRLRQVIWNLLKNAVKFTPEGGTISVTTSQGEAHDGSRPELVIQIADSGMGIDASALPRIFNAFEQGDASVTNRFGGLGLGLAISKGIVEGHGGTIEASSAGLGQGATLTVRLPVTTAAVPAVAQSRPVAGLARGLKILLVEDHADTARAMARLLSQSAHEVQIAGSIEAATRAADSSHFDVVIGDIGLPDGSGLDLMRELRMRHGLSGIALTGYGAESDLRLSRDAGFVDHLTKPVDLEQLERVLEQFARSAPAVEQSARV